MDGFSFGFDFKDFTGSLDELEKAVAFGISRGLVISADRLIADSTAIVPFDHGFNGGLASTAGKDEPIDEEGGNILSIRVGYNSEYAAILHEDMTLQIKQTHANGQPRQQKYLEKPMRENAETYGIILNESVSAVLA